MSLNLILKYLMSRLSLIVPDEPELPDVPLEPEEPLVPESPVAENDITN